MGERTASESQYLRSTFAGPVYQALYSNIKFDFTVEEKFLFVDVQGNLKLVEISSIKNRAASTTTTTGVREQQPQQDQRVPNSERR